MRRCLNPEPPVVVGGISVPMLSFPVWAKSVGTEVSPTGSYTLSPRTGTRRKRSDRRYALTAA
ncbi:DUF6053 domain-containing protein [Lysobacter enzymogenes]|uniref:DUF6053 domain-containing protein n=1 Tax=Lysobacter enzymogenes TaxID=69 RepID=UPI00384B58F9